MVGAGELAAYWIVGVFVVWTWGWPGLVGYFALTVFADVAHGRLVTSEWRNHWGPGAVG
jgi:hypothetical protein